MRIIFAILIFNAVLNLLTAQPLTHQDTLRGTITPERAWWDLTYYDLAIDFDIDNKFLRGTNTIYFKVLDPHQVMQIDVLSG